MSQKSIIEEILSERKRQDLVFGEQNHDPVRWISILAEEVGSAAKKANNMRSANDERINELHLHKYETEVIQIAAVALAMLECLERGKWKVYTVYVEGGPEVKMP